MFIKKSWNVSVMPIIWKRKNAIEKVTRGPWATSLTWEQFNSINTYDYIITLIKIRKKPKINFMRIYWFFIWTNLNPLHPRMLCAKFGWNWPSVSREEDFLISSVFFRYFVIFLPLKKGGALHLNKLEFP